MIIALDCIKVSTVTGYSQTEGCSLDSLLVDDGKVLFLKRTFIKLARFIAASMSRNKLSTEHDVWPVVLNSPNQILL